MVLYVRKEMKDMDKYITGSMIRRLREEKQMTQEQLADILHVSSKAVSKWETGQGFPDITLLEPIAKALDISMIELLSGQNIHNRNRNSNMLNALVYVCPVCGNGMMVMGEAVISCCGITLPPVQPEDADAEHAINVSIVEDEYYVTVDHPMTRDHFITCFAALSDRGVQFVKLYPEEFAEARFKMSRVKWIYAYCNKHGMFRVSTKGIKR